MVNYASSARAPSTRQRSSAIRWRAQAALSTVLVGASLLVSGCAAPYAAAPIASLPPPPLTEDPTVGPAGGMIGAPKGAITADPTRYRTVYVIPLDRDPCSAVPQLIAALSGLGYTASIPPQPQAIRPASDVSPTNQPTGDMSRSPREVVREPQIPAGALLCRVKYARDVRNIYQLNVVLYDPGTNSLAYTGWGAMGAALIKQDQAISITINQALKKLRKQIAEAGGLH